MSEQKSTESQRDAKGRFPKGVSGNRAGRPRSESAILRERLVKDGEAIVGKVIEAALAGDMQAARIILERLLPALKASAQPVTIELPPGFTPLTAANAILSAAAAGMIPPDVAGQLITATGTLARVTEIEELRDRITALERATLPTVTNKKPKP